MTPSLLTRFLAFRHKTRVRLRRGRLNLKAHLRTRRGRQTAFAYTLVLIATGLYLQPTPQAALQGTMAKVSPPPVAPASVPLEVNDTLGQAASQAHLRLFLGTILSHDATTYARQLSRSHAWADTGVVAALERQFIAGGVLSYYKNHAARQQNHIDSIQVLQLAGHAVARVYSHNKVWEANRLVRSYPVAVILALEPAPITVANPYGRHITRLGFLPTPR